MTARRAFAVLPLILFACNTEVEPVETTENRLGTARAGEHVDIDALVMGDGHMCTLLKDATVRCSPVVGRRGQVREMRRRVQLQLRPQHIRLRRQGRLAELHGHGEGGSERRDRLGLGERAERQPRRGPHGLGVLRRRRNRLVLGPKQQRLVRHGQASARRRGRRRGRDGSLRELQRLRAPPRRRHRVLEDGGGRQRLERRRADVPAARGARKTRNADQPPVTPSADSVA